MDRIAVGGTGEGGEAVSGKTCMVCSAAFPAGTEHECPPGVRKRFDVDMWTRQIQLTFTNRGRGWGKAAALKKARETKPDITPAQVAAIGEGTIERAEVYGWFGIVDEVSP